VLYPSILLMACNGVYSVNHSTFDLMLAGVFGIVGFIMMRLDLDRPTSSARCWPVQKIETMQPVLSW
jgi:TctA family transporter